MSQALGSLLVEIGASTARLEKDLAKTRQDFDRWGSSMTTIAKGIGVAIGGALSIAAATRMVKETIDIADSMAKLSQSIGVAVEDLTAYRHAANLSGTSIESLGNALGRLSANISDTAKGTGEAKDAFAALRISVKNADGSLKDTDAIVEEVADRFARMKDGAEKTALAMKLFGKSGKELIPMLNQGAAGIRGMKDEAARLGLVISTETAKAAEKFNDDLTRLSAAVDGLKNKIVAGMLPALASWAETFQSVFAPSAAQELSDLDQRINHLNRTIEENAKGRGWLGKWLANSAREEVAALNEKRTALAATVEAQRAAADASKNIFVPAMVDEKKALDAVAEAAANAFELRMWLMEEHNRQAEENTKNIMTRLKREAAAEDEADRISFENRMAKMQAENAAAEENSNAIMARLKRDADAAQKMTSDIDNAVTGWAAGFSGTLTDMAFGAKRTFGEILESFARMITQMMIQRAVVEPLLGAMGFGTPKTASANGNVFASGHLQAFARGGIVNGPTVFPMAKGMGLMGEAGPEAIMPLKRGRNGKLGVEGGGGTVVQIFNNTGSSNVREERSSQGGKELVKIFIDAVDEAIGSGRMDKTLGRSFGLQRGGVR